MYKPVKPPEHIDMDVRHLCYRLHCWGDRAASPMILLHGWADVGMSFQFLADAMSDRWYLVAPDWRGFGDSGWQPGGYWFPDYLADLEVMIDRISPDKPVRLVGHSMGGNIAWLYAGIRPDRVSHAVSLDLYGLPDSSPAEAPAHYAEWLDQLKLGQAFSNYNDLSAVTGRIAGLAPRLERDKAEFLAGYWANACADGTYQLKHDPAHKRINPVLYRREEVKSCWRQITARTLLVLAAESMFHDKYYSQGHQTELKQCIRDYTEAIIPASGHMMHLEQPEALARTLDIFLE